MTPRIDEAARAEHSSRRDRRYRASSLASATALAIAIVTANMLATMPAHADDASKARCKASYETAQVLQREEKLAAARAQIAICRETCPPALTSECATWEKELAALVPTVVFEVTDPAGKRVTDVRVAVDGQIVARSLEAPLEVDPGSHVFRFESPRASAVETRAEVHAGERGHVVAVVIAPLRAAASTDQASSTPIGAPESERSRVPSYVAFGLGGAFLVASGVILIKSHVDRSDLLASCAPFCDQKDVDTIETLWWTAGGLAAAGAAAMVAGFVLWPRHTSRTAAATMRPTLRLGPTAASASWFFP